MTDLKRGMPPSHPGAMIKQLYIVENGFSGADIARALKMSNSAVNRLIQGKAAVTPSMAIRLSKVLHGTPELWLSLQSKYDLWIAKEESQGLELERLVCN